MNEQIMEVQSGTPDAPAEPPKKAPKPKKRRRWVRRLAVLAVLALIGAGAYRILSAPKVLQPSAGYQVEQAARRDIQVTVSGSATLEPADAYNVNALVTGEIISSPFE